MYRNLVKDLINWKNSPDRKPLILGGARQVGKTYLLREFGARYFSKTHYLSFQTDQKLRDIFERDLKIDRIIKELEYYIDRKINIEEDLLVFDEIQESPKTLESLKYFCEEVPRLAIASAGSLLGVKLSGISFPVGKVNFLSLFPMNFEEFLIGREDTKGIELIQNILDEKHTSSHAHEYLLSRLREYFITGGFPEAVNAFIKLTSEPDTFDLSQFYKNKSGIHIEILDSISNDVRVEKIRTDSLLHHQVRHIQGEIINGYIRDFSKHSGKLNSIHINGVYENIPIQLSQSINSSVAKYKFKDVLPKKKGYGALEGPISWLDNANLIHKVYLCNHSSHPLKSHTKNNFFKLYYNDVGLLGASLGISPSSLVLQNYGSTKGFFAENYVLQSMINSSEQTLFSWQENQAKIEFLIEHEGSVIPIEVKSGTRVKAKSLESYHKRYNPDYSIKVSALPLSINKSRSTKLINLPLYLSHYLEKNKIGIILGI